MTNIYSGSHSILQHKIYHSYILVFLHEANAPRGSVLPARVPKHVTRSTRWRPRLGPRAGGGRRLVVRRGAGVREAEADAAVPVCLLPRGLVVSVQIVHDLVVVGNKRGAATRLLAAPPPPPRPHS